MNIIKRNSFPLEHTCSFLPLQWLVFTFSNGLSLLFFLYLLNLILFQIETISNYAVATNGGAAAVAAVVDSKIPQELQFYFLGFAVSPVFGVLSFGRNLYSSSREQVQH